MSIDSGSVRNDESRELRIQRDRERLKAALPTHIGRFLGKLDDSARQRVCNRVAEVLDRYEDYFLSSCLARVIYNTVVQEFLGVPHDADFEAGLVSAHLFTRLALPGSQLTLASSAKELNTHWRNERARIMASDALSVTTKSGREASPSSDEDVHARMPHTQDAQGPKERDLAKKKWTRRSQRYEVIDEALRGIAQSVPRTQEEVFQSLEERHVVFPSAEPFMTARGWLAGFRRNKSAARSWLSKRWAELDLPPLPRGPKHPQK